MYRERSSHVPGAVLWTRTIRDGAGPIRVLPDGCQDLIWLGDRLIVAGPDTRPQLTTGPAGARYVGLRFAPGTGPAALGVPADELRDHRVPLEAIWPGAEVRRLTERIADAADPAPLLESVAADRMDRAGPLDPAIRLVVARLRAGATVRSVAGTLGLSPRQLHRRCLTAFGYGPKTLARVLRMSGAVSLACGGTPFAAVAAESGYADQAHLSREVRALAGVPLGVLVDRAS
jgi:AraC-like DNA-binding protein